MEKVGLAAAGDKQIGQYSGGMKQRLGIAQAIIHKPKLLLLDEPVSSLDPLGRREVMALLESLKKEMTILFSTHILGDADEICDSLLLLYKGSIVESGSLEDLREKYHTNKIVLVFTHDAKKYYNQLSLLPSIENALRDNNKITVTTAKQNLAREEIFIAAAKGKWPIIRLECLHATLEDMFMKVVDNDCNG